MSRVDNLNCISHTTILSFSLFPCGVRIITLLNKVSHLAKTYELISNDLIISIKCDTCYITFSHFQITGTLS